MSYYSKFNGYSSYTSKTGGAKSSFWKSSADKYTSSNYWLRGSIFERSKSIFDENTMEDSFNKSSRDLVQLSQYQRAIGNFVRILTGRNDIKVEYNSQGNNHTDGTTVTISPNIKENEFDAGVGLALHEASHIVYTDFTKANNYFTKFENYLNSCGMEWGQVYTRVQRLKIITNLVEDLYIDAMTYATAPGYRGYYSALYNKFFGNKNIIKGFNSTQYAEPTWESYLFHLINIRNPHRNLSALPGLQEIFDILNLKNITRLSDMEDRLNLARSIESLINHLVQIDPNSPSLSSQNGNDEDDSDSDGDDDSDDSGNSSTLMELPSSTISSLTKLIKKQVELINGNTTKGKLTKQEAASIQAFKDVDIKKETVGKTFNQYGDSDASFSRTGLPLYVIRNINDSFMNNDQQFQAFTYLNSWRHTSLSKIVADGISAGKILAKKLQVRNEERVLKSTRLDSGKIDKRLLHEIGFDNFDVFAKININTYKPTYIHLSIDQSNSMNSFWDDTVKFAAMIATVSKFIPNIHLQVTTRSSFNQKGGHLPYLMYVFDSKKNSIKDIQRIFSRMQPSAYTPEGLCFEGIMKEIVQQSRNNDAYFLNICDGQPCLQYGTRYNTFNYTHTPAMKHSRLQMKNMEKNGIKFITYFIGNSYTFEYVKQCYGENAVHLPNSSDLSKIAKSLNDKLLAQ